jgi:tetratricopeptide (TPR) repeat protein
MRILWVLIGLLIILVGGAAAFYLRWTPNASSAGDPMTDAATQVRQDPSRPVLARLDQLYAALCDPMTGEPGAPASTAGVRHVTDALRDASQSNPRDPALHRLLGEYLLVGGMNLAAIAELRSAADAGEDPSKLAVPLAFALLRADRLEDLAALRVPQASAPHQIAVLYLVEAKAEVTLDHEPQAQIALQRALDAEPRNLGVIEQLGLLNLRQHQSATSGRWLAQATAIDPDAAATLRLRGEYGFATRDFADSALAYGKLLGMHAHSEVGAPVLGLARAQIYQGDLKSAADTLDHAGLPGNDPHLGYYRALLAFRLGDFARASDLAEPLANRIQGFPDLDLLIGVAKLATGYPETALHYLRHYVDAVPDNSAAQALLDDASERVTGADSGQPIAPRQLAAPFGFAAGKADTVAK